MRKKEKPKPFSARITTKTKRKLEDLAKWYKVPQVHIFECLIWREHEKEERKRAG